jgi:hypothetical protein
MKALLSLFLVLSLNANANVFDDIGGWVKGAADDNQVLKCPDYAPQNN